MDLPHSRVLRDSDLVQSFLEEDLEVDYKEIPTVIRDIVTTECFLSYLEDKDTTLFSTKHRDRDYVMEEDRWGLRKRIVQELYGFQRLESDDDLSLGVGGALPVTGVKKEGKAYILIGPPASGKSSIANRLADEMGAIILDSDYAKRKLPEYNYTAGASIVNIESGRIIWGFVGNNRNGFKSLYELASKDHNNLVISKIGDKCNVIAQTAQNLIDRGYEVHLTLIVLKKREAAVRALYRFHQTKRYVPLLYILYQVASKPILNYNLLKQTRRDLFKSFGIISTDVKMNESPLCIYKDGDNPAGKLNQFFINT